MQGVRSSILSYGKMECHASDKHCACMSPDDEEKLLFCRQEWECPERIFLSRTRTFTVQVSAAIDNVQEKDGVSTNHQSLICACEQWEDGNAFSGYDVQQEPMLSLALHLCGGTQCSEKTLADMTNMKATTQDTVYIQHFILARMQLEDGCAISEHDSVLHLVLHLCGGTQCFEKTLADMTNMKATTQDTVYIQHFILARMQLEDGCAISEHDSVLHLVLHLCGGTQCFEKTLADMTNMKATTQDTVYIQHFILARMQLEDGCAISDHDSVLHLVLHPCGGTQCFEKTLADMTNMKATTQDTVYIQHFILARMQLEDGCAISDHDSVLHLVLHLCGGTQCFEKTLADMTNTKATTQDTVYIQHFILARMQLEDGCAISDHDSVLHLVLHLRGGTQCFEKTLADMTNMKATTQDMVYIQHFILARMQLEDGCAISDHDSVLHLVLHLCGGTQCFEKTLADTTVSAHMKATTQGTANISLIQWRLIFASEQSDDKEFMLYVMLPLLGSMHTFVTTLTSKTITLVVEASKAFGNAKAQIPDKTGVPPEKPRLIYPGGQLEDRRSLSDHKRFTLHMMLALLDGTQTFVATLARKTITLVGLRDPS